MLAQRLRCWSIIKTTLDQRLVFDGCQFLRVSNMWYGLPFKAKRQYLLILQVSIPPIGFAEQCCHAESECDLHKVIG